MYWGSASTSISRFNTLNNQSIEIKITPKVDINELTLAGKSGNKGIKIKKKRKKLFLIFGKYKEPTINNNKKINAGASQTEYTPLINITKNSIRNNNPRYLYKSIFFIACSINVFS